MNTSQTPAGPNTTPDSPENVPRPSRVACVLLAAVVLGQVAAAIAGQVLAIRPEFAPWNIDGFAALKSWCVDLATGGLIDFARFWFVGFLVPLAWGHARTYIGSCGRLLIVCLIIAVIRGTELHDLPGAASLALPLTAGLVGALIGFRWVRGWKARLWLVPQLAGLALVLAAGAAWMLNQALDTTSRSPEPVKVTSAAKRHVVAKLKQARIATNGQRNIELEQQDINILLAWGLPVLPGEPRLSAELDTDRTRLQASARLPLPGGRQRYLNLDTTIKLYAVDGILDADVESLQVGALRLPSFMCGWLTSASMSSITSDPDLSEALSAVKTIKIDQHAISIAEDSKETTNGLISKLVQRFGGSGDLPESIAIYQQHLIASAATWPVGADRFGAALQSAFALAQKRSRHEDPVAENRSAILSLAILFGHHRLKLLVGDFSLGKITDAEKRRLGSLTIRRRSDWVQHFFVSSGLTVVVNSKASDAVGLMKEELDADGGSGFSFADLLADRAGTLFATAATSDAAAATAMQNRLANGFLIDDYFPPAADLPEGIPDATFQSEYGGVGGAKYQQILAEIERRLATCPGLK